MLMESIGWTVIGERWRTVIGARGGMLPLTPAWPRRAAAAAVVFICPHSMQYNGGKDMTSGSFTSTADIDFYIDVDAAGTELVIVSDNITTRHQVRVRF